MNEVVARLMGPGTSALSAQVAFSELPQHALDLPATKEGDAQAVRLLTSIAERAVPTRPPVRRGRVLAGELSLGSLLVFLLQEEDSHAAYFLRKQGLDRLTSPPGLHFRTSVGANLAKMPKKTENASPPRNQASFPKRSIPAHASTVGMRQPGLGSRSRIDGQRKRGTCAAGYIHTNRTTMTSALTKRP